MPEVQNILITSSPQRMRLCFGPLNRIYAIKNIARHLFPSLCQENPVISGNYLIFIT